MEPRCLRSKLQERGWEGEGEGERGARVDEVSVGVNCNFGLYARTGQAKRPSHTRAHYILCICMPCAGGCTLLYLSRTSNGPGGQGRARERVISPSSFIFSFTKTTAPHTGNYSLDRVWVMYNLVDAHVCHPREGEADNAHHGPHLQTEA